MTTELFSFKVKRKSHKITHKKKQQENNKTKTKRNKND